MIFADPVAMIPDGIELVRPFASREIVAAFHDIDGTHSLIRDWVPVMTLCCGYVSVHGFPDSLEKLLFDDPANYPEAHKFAVESAGLSALTQMEWAIRRALENGVLETVRFDREVNSEIIRRIWNGAERFDDLAEEPEFRCFLAEKTPELFRCYEKLLLVMSRNRNLAEAQCDPEKWRVPGSMEFLSYLANCGVANFFVTGAVVEYDHAGNLLGTMYEEISALGYRRNVHYEMLVGSSWEKKKPKGEIMRQLCREHGFAPENILVVGDGRSEIAAAAEMGSVALSRLDRSALRAREIHRTQGTNLIAERYDRSWVERIFRICSNTSN